MPRYFLHSCSKIQARREKDLTSEMRLNSAKNVRLKKRDEWTKNGQKAKCKCKKMAQLGQKATLLLTQEKNLCHHWQIIMGKSKQKYNVRLHFYLAQFRNVNLRAMLFSFWWRFPVVVSIDSSTKIWFHFLRFLSHRFSYQSSSSFGFDPLMPKLLM